MSKKRKQLRKKICFYWLYRVLWLKINDYARGDAMPSQLTYNSNLSSLIIAICKWRTNYTVCNSDILLNVEHCNKATAASYQKFIFSVHGASEKWEFENSDQYYYGIV